MIFQNIPRGYKSILPMIYLVVAITFLCGTEAHAGVVTADTIKAAVVGHIMNTIGKKGIEINADVPSVFDVDVAHTGVPELRVTNGTVKKLAKRLPVTVDFCDNDGEVLKRIRLTASLKYYDDAVVTKCDFGRGDSITASDVSIIKVDVTGMENYYKSPLELNGMQANKLLKTGSVLTESDVRPAYVVQRGDKVSVEVHDGDVSMYVGGTARGSGAEGESIRVYIDMTKTTISCRIKDSTTVEAGVEGG